MEWDDSNRMKYFNHKTNLIVLSKKNVNVWSRFQEIEKQDNIQSDANGGT